MKRKLTILLIIIGVFVCAINAYSQKNTHTKQYLNSFKLKIDTSKSYITSNNIKQQLNFQLNIPSDYDLRINNPINNKEVKVEIDELGFTHDRLIQYYKGIKVDNSDIRVHYKNDKVVSANGEYVNEAKIDIIPILDKDNAIEKALQFVKARKYKWEIPEENTWLQNVTNDKSATFYPNPELVICKSHFNLEDSIFHLAYKIDIYATEPLSRSYIYVDAKNGSILNAETIIKSIGENAQTRYSGYRTISTHHRSSDFILKDNSRGEGIETKNLERTNNYSGAVEFTDFNNDWVEHGNNYKDNAALDAHWGIMMTYDYFKNVHHRDSYNNQGAIIRNFVHYRYKYNGSFWDRNPANVMSFGDGDDIKFDALTSLDVTAHEFSHAICEYTANLIYQGESGAINEGLSDIWAACVENYADPEKSKWEIGEEIMRNGHPALRSMVNPNSELQPDTYGGTYWVDQNDCVPSDFNDNCGVHTNSGVMNYWFYLLVNGGANTNDIGNIFNTLAIGIDKAAKIVYRSENQYWTQGSDYNDARTYTIDAAIDLYRNYSEEVVAVTNSWYAVGVGPAFSCDDLQDIFNEVFVVDTIIPACSIQLQYIMVQDGAKLTLDVVKDVEISGPFEVELYSEFETK